MASYAEMASRGPKQTPEEAAAPQLAEVLPTDTSVESLVDVDHGSVQVVSADYKDQEIKTDTQAQRVELEEVAKEEQAARDKVADLKAKGKKKVAKAEDYAKNPVYAANAVLSTILALTLGVNAYKKYKVGELSWKVVGIYTGALGAFGAVDFYATKFFNAKYEQSKK